MRQLSQLDIDRIDADKKDRARLETITELWRVSGVRARHRSGVKSKSAQWSECFASLSKRIGYGMIVALIGLRGTGKSQLAVELIRASCHDCQQALYTTAMDIFIDLRDAYKLHESERAVLLRFQRPSLLVIDEAQERGETPWEDRMLTALLDYRYSQKRDTILISNLKRADFEASMGASIVSRMAEAGGIVECNWQSFRNINTK
jgi:DNA replication protein DnaC